jgi:hypothetical protein
MQPGKQPKQPGCQQTCAREELRAPALAPLSSLSETWCCGDIAFNSRRINCTNCLNSCSEAVRAVRGGEAAARDVDAPQRPPGSGASMWSVEWPITAGARALARLHGRHAGVRWPMGADAIEGGAPRHIKSDCTERWGRGQRAPGAWSTGLPAPRAGNGDIV